MRTPKQDYVPTEKYIADITSLNQLIKDYPDDRLIPQFKTLQR